MRADFFEQKYKGIDPDIASKIENYEYEYFREDKPVPFCGLKVYPITVRDYEVFASCSACLTLNKNETVEGIRSSHLEFLLSKVIQKDEEGASWSYRFQKLLEMIFHIKNGIKCSKCGHVIAYSDEIFINFIKQLQETKDLSDLENIPKLCCPECGSEEFSEMIKIEKDQKSGKYYLLVDGHKIEKNDFNLLRQLVLFQNDPDYRDESWIDPVLKKDHDEKKRLQQEANDVYASIEQKVVGLSITTNYKFDEIWNMSIRKFTMALSTVDDLINYKIMKTAISSGFVSLPKGEKIDHWLLKPLRDMYGDSYKSVDQAVAEANNL